MMEQLRPMRELTADEKKKEEVKEGKKVAQQLSSREKDGAQRVRFEDAPSMWKKYPPPKEASE